MNWSVSKWISSKIKKVSCVTGLYSGWLRVVEKKRTVGGDKLMADPRRSCGPMLECLRMGRPPPLPGVPPGEELHEGAIRILGGPISWLSDNRLLGGNALCTRRKLLSGDAGDPPNHQPPNIPGENVPIANG
jgi:hypothetical protein